MSGDLHVLGSFHFLRKKNLADLLAAPVPVDFFADSGAFSAFTTGAEVKLPDYAAWLSDHAALVNCAATLDVIGDPKGTDRNTELLNDRLGGRVQIVAAFHVGSPWSELERLCKRHPYVALGGAVGVLQREAAMSRWLIRAHKIARDHDTRLHGFGQTRPPYPSLVPWYSIDSSYWSSANRTGTLMLWDGRDWVKFRVGRPAAAKHARLIRAYGGNPARAARPGFALVGRHGPIARLDGQWMNTASALSWNRYAEHIRVRRGPVPPPRAGVTTGDGLKVYFAVGSRSDVDRLVEAFTVAPAEWSVAA